MLGNGPEQTCSTTSAAGSDLYTDGRASDWRARAAKHHGGTADSDWSANSDHNSGGRPTERASNTEYAGHHSAEWDDSGNAGEHTAG